jgi:transposase
MNKKYIIRLTDEERTQLQDIVSKGKAAAYRIKHANVLLKADANDSQWSDEHIAEALSTTANTVRNIRQRFVEHGLESALGRKKRKTPPRKKSLDGHQEARLIALRCSEPPAGYARWTLHLLADTLVELHVVERISHETIRQTLKKMN